MSFNSSSFFYLLIIILIFRILLKNSNNKYYIICVCIVSTIFYGWNEPTHLLIIWFIVSLSYFSGRIIYTSVNKSFKKFILIFNVFIILSLLFSLKYFSNYNELGFLIPIGISFYSFQALSYIFDINSGNVALCKRFINYYVYITFFPQLIAGPIVKAKDFLYQLGRNRKLNRYSLQGGFFFLIYGFFLKVVIADNISVVVDRFWNEAFYIENGNLLALLILLLFGFQIFSDFAGYSSIAIGLGYLLGFKLPTNFNSPYIASSFSNFWKRWHITLSSWLKEYLYIPLGGNKNGDIKTYRNLLLVMILGGAWHGGSYNFIIWGMIHGMALIIERFIISKLHSQLYNKFIVKFFWFVCVQMIVFIAWIFFRTEELRHAMLFLRTLLLGWTSPNFTQHYWEDIGIAFIFTIPILISHVISLCNEYLNLELKKIKLFKSIISGLMLFLIIVLYGNSNQFIYFVF